MKKTVGFVLLEPFADWESAYLASALTMLGEGEYATCFLSPDGGAVRSIGGLTVKTDAVLEKVSLCDALVLIGGLSWRLEAARPVEAVVKRYIETGRPLGAICDAVSVLARLGFLNDRRHTGNGIDELISAAPDNYSGQEHYVCEQAVRDRHLITANGTAALEFALELLLELDVDARKAQEWYEFHKLGFCSASLPQDLASS